MKAALVGTLVVAAMAVTQDVAAQRPPSGSHAIYMTAVEFKGSTTADKLAPPEVDPTKMSHGYVYKAPGQDPSDPQRWEVATHQFSPAFVTVQQGDSIMLSVFIANGDRHEVQLTDPAGETIIAKTTWNRGREYTAFFQTRKHLPTGVRHPCAVDDRDDPRPATREDDALRADAEPETTQKHCGDGSVTRSQEKRGEGHHEMLDDQIRDHGSRSYRGPECSGAGAAGGARLESG